MQVSLLIVALVSGLATLIFILGGLRRVLVHHKAPGSRAFVVTSLCSLATGVFTIWQLVLVAQQLHLVR